MSIIITDLEKSFGETKLFSQLTVTFESGKVSAISGRSGSGKTTLLRIIAGLEAADHGSVQLDSKKLAAVFQDDVLVGSFTPVKNISFAVGKAADKEAILESIGELGLSDSASKKCSELSGGMRRRVSLARAILADADIILLDEPFKGLDESTKDATIEYVRKMTAGKTVILVTHDLTEADKMGAIQVPIPFAEG